jgi:23S rRNA (pseudouridine1915-N3)-methyltransferase
VLIELLSFSKSSGPVVALEHEYLQRLPKGFRVELKDLSATIKGVDMHKAGATYANVLQGFLSQDAQLVLLEERGKHFTSEAFSEFLQDKMLHGPKIIRCALAGPYGWGSLGCETRTGKLKGAFSLSLSTLTFPSHLARLILIEQLYRASTIISGKSYHK